MQLTQNTVWTLRPLLEAYRRSSLLQYAHQLTCNYGYAQWLKRKCHLARKFHFRDGSQAVACLHTCLFPIIGYQTHNQQYKVYRTAEGCRTRQRCVGDCKPRWHNSHTQHLPAVWPVVSARYSLKCTVALHTGTCTTWCTQLTFTFQSWRKHASWFLT